MKVLFVTRCLTPKYNDGALMVTKRNYDMLKNIFGPENVDLIELDKPNIILKFFNIIFGQSYGQTIRKLFHYRQLLKHNYYDFIFFNSSLYGNLVRICEKHKIQSYVFFHNVEANYYDDLRKYTKSIGANVFYKYIKRLESLSCSCSTFRITLNERDKNELFNKYGKKADLLLPISMKNVERKFVSNYEGEHYCLFLGSDFYANQQGLSWFIETVQPYINIHLIIAGSICNSLAEKYKDIKGISFLGYVEDIDNIYKNADFIVSPIFLGSGMKTKTVEALSYGKSIIGTDEAFVGIDANISEIGAKCNTAVEFINAINSYDGKLFNSNSYEYFQKNLSDDCIKLKFESFVNLHKKESITK